MRTGGLRRALVPVSIILTLLFSTTFIPTPTFAAAVISYPGHPSQPQNIFDIPQGQTFLLRHRLAWDDEANPGFYLIAIWWDYFADNAYHFTLDNAVAYFDNNGDNLPDPSVALIDNSVSTQDNGTRRSIAVSNAAGDWRLGTLNVDITLRASGPDGTPHVATDNHPIYYTIIQSFEAFPPGPAVAAPGPVTVRVLGLGVDVAISPDHQSEPPGTALSYIVTVTNTGEVPDSYALAASDNAGWELELSENLLEIPLGEDETTTLTVTVPEEAVPYTKDNVTVTATSQINNAVSGSANCIAHAKFVPRYEVDVTVEPKHRRGTPGTENLTFLVTVHNTGNIEDNYLLSVEPDGWPMENITFKNDWLENVQPGENKTTRLYVHIPEDATPCTHKEIVVIADSEFYTATDSDNALIQVVSAYLHAEGPIDLGDPDNTQWHELYPNFSKSYHLTSWEDTNGDGKLNPGDQIEMENETGELDNYYVKDVTVTIFISKKWDFIDNMYLEFEDGFEKMENAIKKPENTQWHEIRPVFSRRYHLVSWDDNNGDENLSPSDQIFMMNKDNGEIAKYHVDEVATDIVICKKPPIAYEVDVTVEPGFKEGPPSTWLEYTVTVTNTGTIDDNYDLVLSDNAGWGDTQLDNNTLTVPVGGNRTTTLRVHIPDNAIPSTEDEVTVTATSQGDSSVSDDDTCIAHATIGRGVKLSISPPYQEDLQGGTLSYDVTVFNTGNVEDNYALENADNEGWTLTLDNTLLTIPPWKSRTTTLSVTIPGNAIPSTEDNITITATSTENAEVSTENSCIAHVEEERSVTVSISPAAKSGPPGGTLTYDVTITNTGNVDDTYGLAASDLGTPSWNPTVSPTSLTIAAGGSEIATLSVTILSDESVGTQHTIEVTATSQTVPTVGNIGDCTAEATALWRVEVSISPDNQSGGPKENLTYTVTVKNTGTDADNYDLEISDNAGWGDNITLSDDLLEVPADGEETVTLTVTIPEDAENGAEDNITVTATSTENEEVSESASCTATAIVVRGVEVSISPENQDGPPGEMLTYEIMVTNKGNVDDTYDLTKSDEENWILTMVTSLLEVPPGENRTANLRVRIPGNATHSTRDNVTVTATSQADNTVENSASTIAHAVIIRDVEVSISPTHRSDEPGEKLEYTVTVTNNGNVEDIYNLTTSDEAVQSWNPTISPIFLVIDAGESDTANLSVTIPSGAGHGEKNDIQVTATSQENAEVSVSATCQAEVSIRVRIGVSVSPSAGSGEPGTSLTYTVTIRNVGLIDDTYTLRAVGREGWSLIIEPDELFLAAGATGEATLTVVVPPDASVGDSMTTQVSVRSEEDPAVVESDTCRVIVTGAEKAAELELPIPLVISVVLIVVIIIVIAYLLRARPKAERRSVLRDVSFGGPR